MMEKFEKVMYHRADEGVSGGDKYEGSMADVSHFLAYSARFGSTSDRRVRAGGP